MKIKIRTFGDLTAIIGDETIVELETGANLKSLISKLVDEVGSLRRDFLGWYDVNGPDLVILLNGRNIHVLKKLETPLKDDDVVTFLPPVVGGKKDIRVSLDY